MPLTPLSYNRGEMEDPNDSPEQLAGGIQWGKRESLQEAFREERCSDGGRKVWWCAGVQIGVWEMDSFSGVEGFVRRAVGKLVNVGRKSDRGRADCRNSSGSSGGYGGGGKSLGLGVAVESLCAEEVHSTAGDARKGGRVGRREGVCVEEDIRGASSGSFFWGAQRNEPDGVGCSESSEKREIERRVRDGRAATKGEGASGRAVGDADKRDASPRSSGQGESDGRLEMISQRGALSRAETIATAHGSQWLTCCRAPIAPSVFAVLLGGDAACWTARRQGRALRARVVEWLSG
ncbi:hypothetical protein B0J11DRAFT_511050 [Dendryphion nanum]|uniref:Uncharacterized protein n=1 Tax=Dendryphion nanum TaxID=256645 RepID=A0A9P9D7U3_9PLEO|nr:hypothetical protein B0J11DRAFT_511050 [Dendryphion nanum]